MAEPVGEAKALERVAQHVADPAIAKRLGRVVALELQLRE